MGLVQDDLSLVLFASLLLIFWFSSARFLSLLILRAFWLGRLVGIFPYNATHCACES